MVVMEGQGRDGGDEAAGDDPPRNAGVGGEDDRRPYRALRGEMVSRSVTN